jgi:hypothetical protein
VSATPPPPSSFPLPYDPFAEFRTGNTNSHPLPSIPATPSPHLPPITRSPTPVNVITGGRFSSTSLPPPDPSTSLVFAAAAVVPDSARGGAAFANSEAPRHSSKLTAERLQNMSDRDVAQTVAVRAGLGILYSFVAMSLQKGVTVLAGTADCIAALQAAGINLVNYKKGFSEDALRKDLSVVDYFTAKPDHMNRVISALLQMKTEAEFGAD